jgi:opacity protein-like surface antigen
MKLRYLAVAFVAAVTSAFSAAAHAQGALYLNPVAVLVKNSTIDNGVYSFLGPNTKSRTYYGVSFGGFYDIPLQTKQFEVGVDIRDQLLHANNSELNGFLVGLRLSTPVRSRLHPYVEPIVGVGTTRAPNTSLHISRQQYGAFAGVDYDLGKHFSFRVFEAGYTKLITASSETIGGTATIPAATLINFSTGLTIRLPQFGAGQ